jgi:type IV/VI secretion system ImpK/VasF family protein
MTAPREYATELFELCSPLFLYLVSFRRKVRKGYQVGADMVRDDLERLFMEAERTARSDPRLEVLYEKAKYPLVVLADEVLLHSEWEHTGAWEKSLLEEKYFQTNIGGDKIFQIASELRYDELELASILFTAISLGVRGSYYRKPEKLAEVKSKLYRQLSEYLAGVHKELSPDAYRVDERPARRLSPAVTLGRIAIVGVGVVALYWVLTFILWSQAVSDLRALVGSLV